jgi:hypothetical protein
MRSSGDGAINNFTNNLQLSTPNTHKRPQTAVTATLFALGIDFDGKLLFKVIE